MKSTKIICRILHVRYTYKKLKSKILIDTLIKKFLVSDFDKDNFGNAISINYQFNL